MHKKKLAVILGTVIVLILVLILSLVLGTVKVTLGEIAGCISGRITSGFAWQIVNNIRIPRILCGMLVGMNLAAAGVLLQGILRNPMASPNVIGVNAGASLAAIAIMTVIPGKIALIPLAAFIGALLTTLLIYGLSVKQQQSAFATESPIFIVLAGVAVSSLFNAFTSALMILNSDVLDITYSWMLGSLSGRSWQTVKSIAPYSLVGLSAAVFFSPALNLFALGDEMASSVGLKVPLYRLLIIIVASVLAGSAVSAAGAIGFIGLIAPHIARLLLGSDNRYVVPLSALLGGLLLVLSDTIARTLFQPVELSVGIVTSVIGAPLFLSLLTQKRKQR